MQWYDVDGLTFGQGYHSNYIAAFDLDWTLVKPKRGRFPTNQYDWEFLPNRIETLGRLQDNGYSIAIFTNQGYNESKLQKMIQRVKNIANYLTANGIRPWVFIAVGKKSPYRKPDAQMWNVLRHYIPTINYQHSFYVGDMAGRKQDQGDSDLLFAMNARIIFYTPEQIF